MDREIITALGNEEDYLKIFFKKSETFYHFLVGFFSLLDIDYKIDHEIDGSESSPLKCVDFWEEFKNDKYHVELFYGDEHIIMIVRTMENNKTIVTNYLQESCKFLKPSKTC